MVVLGVAINFWQSYRSQQAADRLRASVIPTATVLRDGAWLETSLANVVPGDVFRLSAGDLVPADARLLESRDLSVQQSMLTGESLPADKTPLPTAERQRGRVPTRRTSCSSAPRSSAARERRSPSPPGPKTMFGDIAERLRTRAPETEFEHGLRRFSLLILRTTVVLVLFILLVGIAFKHDAFESLLFAVALGVGLTPEFLPMISSVTLTQGALRMARDQVIVKHLPAIQNFGSIDILCSDKTGTLTAGVMRFDRAVDPVGAQSPRPLTLASVNSRLRDRNPQPARCRDPRAARPGRRQAIGRSTKSRSISSGAVCQWSWRRQMAAAVGCSSPRVHPSRSSSGPQHSKSAARSSPLDAATRQASAAVARAHERGGSARAGGRVPLARPSRDAYSRDDEVDLVLAGFVSFADPVLPDVAEVLAELKRDGVTVKILTGDNELVARHVCQSIGLADLQIVTGEEIERIDDAGAWSPRGAGLGVHACLAGSEEPDHPGAQAPGPRRRIHGRRHQRRPVAAHRGCRHFGDDGRRCRTRRGGCHSRTAQPARLASRDSRRPPGLRQHDEVPADGDELEFRQHVQHGGGVGVPAVPADAADADPLEQLPVRPGPGHHPQRQRRRCLSAAAAALGHAGHPRLHAVHRADQLDLRLSHLLRVAGVTSTRRERLFHTGWFVESLATQTLVLFVIRTMGNPFRSRPSRSLTLTTLLIVAVGIMLPLTPIASLLGFTTLPASYFAFLIPATMTYLALVDVAKRRLARRLGL